MFSTLLTWLNDKTAPVFVIATANNVKELPPELLRKGRFDEIFFVALPHTDERKEIFEIHLRKKKRDPKDFDLDRLAEVTRGFSGSEIEQAVLDSMYDAFDKDVDINTEIIEKAIGNTIPLSTTMKEKIDGIREWSKTRARFASSYEAKLVEQEARGGSLTGSTKRIKFRIQD